MAFLERTAQQRADWEFMTKIKLLVLIEATTVSGPAKNLLGFLRLLSSPAFRAAGIPEVDYSIATFQRAARSQPFASEAAPNAFVAAAREQGVAVDVIAERFAFDPRIIGQLRAIVKRRQPTLIQSHMVKSHFLTKLSGIGRKHPWVAYHHGYTTTDRKMEAYNQLNRWSLPSASRVITVCGAFAKELSQAGVSLDRISVCHNSVVEPAAVSAVERTAFREQLGIPAGEQVILSVGRLSREKGHVDLINTLALLRTLAPSLRFKLVIAGDGPERERIAAAARAHQLTAQVVFAGHATNVQKFYAIADVLALPSHSEGSPNVLLEAMAAGLPVVANAVGGVPEIATSGETALLVAPGDFEAFARGLVQLLTDRQFARRLAQAATTHVRQKFSPETQARSLLDIYQRLQK